MKRSKTVVLATLGLSALGLAFPMTAQAHVSVTPEAAPAGSRAVLEFAVGHGCDGSPTTAVTFQKPEEVISITPTVNPGWVATVDEDSVTYTANVPLADNQRDTFELEMRLPQGEAGDTVAIPVVQTCVEGAHEWIEVGPHDEVDSPAPVVTLTAAGEDHGHGHPSATDDSAGQESSDSAGATSGASPSSTATGATSDALARGISIGALALGVVALILALRRRQEVK